MTLVKRFLDSLASLDYTEREEERGRERERERDRGERGKKKKREREIKQESTTMYTQYLNTAGYS